MGRRQGARSGASRTTFYTPGTLGLEGSMKVVRDVTDEQRRRRPIFIATLGLEPVGRFSALLSRPV
jgi:hypothetical protein